MNKEKAKKIAKSTAAYAGIAVVSAAAGWLAGKAVNAILNR